MALPVGRNLSLSISRRMICDLMHFSQKVPMVMGERRLDLAALAEARKAARPRPSWCAILTKAYALAAVRWPLLRCSYIPFPWPHLYEHPESVASITVERQLDNERGLFFVLVSRPEQKSLSEVDTVIRRATEAPVDEIGSFRRILRISRLPRPLRRLIWRVGLYTSGRQRAHHFGTFGVTSTAGAGFRSIHLLSPLTSTLTYASFNEDGTLDLRLAVDHRVMDGAEGCRAIREMERIFRTEIMEELRQLQVRKAA